MKRLGHLIPFLLLLAVGNPVLYAQDVDSLANDPIPEVLPVVETLEIPVALDRISMDEKIDNGFAPFGNAVTNFVFYAPVIGQDALFGQTGTLRSDKDFYETPPFTLDYAKGHGIPTGSIFQVTQGDGGNLILTYDKSTTLPVGQATKLEGMDITIQSDASLYDSQNDQLGLRVKTVDREAKGISNIVLSSAPLEMEVDATKIDEVTVNFTKSISIKAGELVTEDGLNLTITPNENSNYAFEQGKVYTFQVNNISFLPIVIIILILGATYFTIAFKFVNLTKFRLAIDVVRGAYTDPNDTGEVSHFQALTAALSGTVGLGNIAGVAVAISIGGAGATFWMILAGLLGMSSKFVECTLGVKYRIVKENGEVSGGPMYYLSQGLADKGYATLGKVFAAIFAVMCIGGSFGGGNMFQVNQAFQQFAGLGFIQGTWFAANGWFFGLVMASFVAVVIIGGIKSIASVTDKIVPFMCGIYVLAALIIIVMNIGEVPRVFGEIFAGAFAPTAIAGGFVGVLIQGFRRAAFSNEAGVGSASIAHSAVKTNNPASEGIVSLLEPFIDTVVVCTMTALVIIITNNHLDPNASDGVALTSRAFSSQLPFFKYILSIAVILFAFSTQITWSYYGLKAWTYLFGDNRVTDTVYKVLFLIFVVIGAAASLGSVIGFSDAMIFAMAVPNIIGLVILVPVVRKELEKYIGKIKSGEIVKVK